MDYLDKEGWRFEDGLYHKLINEYNATNTAILRRWKRHDED